MREHYISLVTHGPPVLQKFPSNHPMNSANLDFALHYSSLNSRQNFNPAYFHPYPTPALKHNKSTSWSYPDILRWKALAAMSEESNPA